jgi:hypothetical protein
VFFFLQICSGVLRWYSTQGGVSCPLQGKKTFFLLVHSKLHKMCYRALSMTFSNVSRMFFRSFTYHDTWETVAFPQNQITKYLMRKRFFPGRALYLLLQEWGPGMSFFSWSTRDCVWLMSSLDLKRGIGPWNTLILLAYERLGGTDNPAWAFLWRSGKRNRNPIDTQTGP